MRQVKMTRDSFHVFQANARNALKQSEQVPSILICAGTGCIAGGAMKIYDNLKTECEKRGLPVYVGLKHDTDAEKSLHVKMSGCHGFCEMGPLVHIEPMGVMYIHVKPEDCHEILEKTVLGGEIIDRLVYHLDGVAYPRQEDIPFYKKQHRVVLENCGSSDAEDIEEYIAKGGYAGFEKALFEMTDEEICRSIIDSGLRGRGGGGFPAGQKWDGARKQKSEKKYIVCNGDEGDPGAFMDRSIMEGNPHSVLEGMMIAGRAVGSDEGYIYVRAEYPLAVSRLKAAIAKAEEYGLLGDHVMGTDFSFRIHVNMGAGAFVCGEGSALTASIEGNRGMPLLLVIMAVVSLLAGAAWGMVPATFKAVWNTNETLFTLMMNYVAIQLTSYFVALWENPVGSNTVGVINQRTKDGWFPELFGQEYGLNVVLVLLLTVGMFLYLKYSKQGYEISVVGDSENTARYAGINVKKVTIRTMAISGAICGLAGFIAVAGASHTISTSTAGGRGFTAIIVAWLAQFNTFVMILISFLLVFLQKGAIQIASQFNLNDYASNIITGIILFFILGSEFFINYRIILRGGKEGAK